MAIDGDLAFGCAALYRSTQSSTRRAYSQRLLLLTRAFAGCGVWKLALAEAFTHAHKVGQVRLAPHVIVPHAARYSQRRVRQRIDKHPPQRAVLCKVRAAALSNRHVKAHDTAAAGAHRRGDFNLGARVFRPLRSAA